MNIPVWFLLLAAPFSLIGVFTIAVLLSSYNEVKENT